MKNRCATVHQAPAVRTQDSGQRGLMTVPECAAGLAVTPACVRRWILEKKIAIVKLGRLVRIPRSEVTRMIDDGLRPAVNDTRRRS